MLQKAVSSWFSDMFLMKSSKPDNGVTVVTAYDFVPVFDFTACFSFSNFS
jgi:hypothetical protein